MKATTRIFILVIAGALTLAVSAEALAQGAQRKGGAAAPATSAAREGEFRNRSSSFNWDAFVDVEGRVANKDTLQDQGFTLNDASLGFSKDFSRGFAVVELPFASDLSGGTNRFTFAENRAQAYLGVKYQPIEFRIGQYHTIFGYETNDSRGRFIADAGAIKTYLIPTTHTGVLATYRNGGITARGQFVNPSSRGTMTQVSPEFGLQGRMDFGRAYGQVGFSLNEAKSNSTNQNTNKTNMLVDLIVGGNMDKASFGGEIVIRKASGSDKTANAFGVFGVYQHTDALGLGGRIELIKDAFVTLSPGTSGTLESVFAFAAGPSYKLDSDLTVRGDFSLGTTKVAGGSNETLYGLTVSLLAQL